MSALSQLQAATSLSDVAVLLKLQPKTLAYILHGMSAEAKYISFKISKKTGGTRTISAPTTELKYAQKMLASLLQDCIDDINKAKDIKSVLSHGFRRNRSIITNAVNHRNKRYVFNIDLENFFGAINFGRVRGFFIVNKNFQLNTSVATVIAQIACHDNGLPQGSPCSPVISNLIGHILDIRLAELALQNKCDYSRYADDITFSTNLRDFPTQIAEKENGEGSQFQAGQKLVKIIHKAGFTVNSSKTRMQHRISRQQVTGLVVNTKVNVRSEYYRAVRSMTHLLIRTGKFYLPEVILNDSETPYNGEKEGTIAQLNGMLSFISSVGTYNRKKDQPDNKNNDDDETYNYESLTSNDKVYRNFLLYKNFYAPVLPTIICEGKTDNIYLLAAIRSLATEFPQLVDKQTDGKKKLKVKFFHYNKLTQRLMNLAGGTSQLATLIATYNKLFQKFKAPKAQHPVIIVIDHDDGAKAIISTLKKVKNDPTLDGSAPFYWVHKNLYVVFIPKIANKPTAIEDLFPPSVLKIKFNGKTFNKSNNHDTKAEYGKYCFAENIIAKNQSTIDFSGFKPILERLTLPIADYTK